MFSASPGAPCRQREPPVSLREPHLEERPQLAPRKPPPRPPRPRARKGRGAARARPPKPIRAAGRLAQPARPFLFGAGGAGGAGRGGGAPPCSAVGIVPGRVRGVAGAGGARAMLITLCYLYLWARWGPRSAALIRRTVRRLHRSRCSFTFCRCAGPAARQPPPPSSPSHEEQVCLRIGNKVFFTDETQVPPRALGLRPGRCFARRCPGPGRSRAGSGLPCYRGNGQPPSPPAAGRTARLPPLLPHPLSPTPAAPGHASRGRGGGVEQGGGGGGGGGRRCGLRWRVPEGKGSGGCGARGCAFSCGV